DRRLEFGEHIVVHLVAAGAELFGVGCLHRGVEPAPEDDPGDKAAERQEAEAVMDARTAERVPIGFEPAPDLGPDRAKPAALHCVSPSTSMPRKRFSTSGCASVCTTWHWTQK